MSVVNVGKFSTTFEINHCFRTLIYRFPLNSVKARYPHDETGNKREAFLLSGYSQVGINRCVRWYWPPSVVLELQVGKDKG